MNKKIIVLKKLINIDIRKALEYRTSRIVLIQGLFYYDNIKNGDSDRIRTCDRRLRRPLLYPAELPSRIKNSCVHIISHLICYFKNKFYFL